MNLLYLLMTITSSYRPLSLPEPAITHLDNGGIEFRVRDIPGTWYVGFHYSINRPIQGSDVGEYNVVVASKTGGVWIYRDDNIAVRSSDTVYYWIEQLVNGVTHTLQGRFWTPPAELNLVFEDNFDTLDLTKWEHAVTASGGGNWEFQIYSQDSNNSYVRDNTLFIKPTLTADRFGEDFLYNGVLNMTAQFGKCTQSEFYGCYREAWAGLINPIMSAKMTTKLSFQYGKVEIIAKMPRGDWLWPAMWFLPKNWKYGDWPKSGEIDLVEVRGNRDYGNKGIQTMGSALHWGPAWNINGFMLTAEERQAKPKWTYADGFHKYVLDWDSTHIRTYVDDVLVLDRPTPPEGYWKLGGFSGGNIWVKGGPDAPFDQEFYLILNVAIGGTMGYFPDSVENKPSPKPWHNNGPTQRKFFWEARSEWYPTWVGEDAALQVKSVKIWKKIQ